MLNYVVRESVREYFAGQWRDGDSCALTLQDVPEVFKIGVAAAHDRMAQLEGGNVGSRVDLVGSVHVAGGGAVRLRVLYLSWVLAIARLVGQGRRRLRKVGLDGAGAVWTH